MKKIIIPNSGFRSVCSLLLLFAVVTLSGQSRTYTKTVTVDSASIIKINPPHAIKLQGNGTISSWFSDEMSHLSWGDNEPAVYEVNQALTIHSWDRQEIKQVVNVSVRGYDSQQTAAFLDALSLTIDQRSNGYAVVDFQLNLETVYIQNGWFREDFTKFILDNGKEFLLEYLKVSGELYVPRSANLKIDGEMAYLTIEEHDGPVEAHLSGGELFAGKLSELSGVFESTDLEINELTKGQLELQEANCDFNTVDYLQIRSSISKININTINTLMIDEAVSDRYELESVRELLMERTRFSDIRTGRLLESADLDAGHSILQLGQLSPDFEELRIENSLGEIHLRLGQMPAYLLEVINDGDTNLQLRQAAQLLKKGNVSTIYQVGEGANLPRIIIKGRGCTVNIKE